MKAMSLLRKYYLTNKLYRIYYITCTYVFSMHNVLLIKYVRLTVNHILYYNNK